MAEGKFWMIWNPSRGVPRAVHRTWDAALVECQRLARLAPGETFVILEAVQARRVVIPPVECVPLDQVRIDDIPF